MKTKILTGLALTIALLIGGPAFGKGHHAVRHAAAHHAVASSHRSSGHRAVASSHRSAGGHHALASASRRSSRIAKNGDRASSRTASNRTRFNGKTASAAHGYAATSGRSGYRGGNRASVAFGGSGYRNSGGHRTYAFSYHDGWDHGRQYYWHGHHYGWYDNGWYIIDPFPYAAAYDGGGSVAVQVQSDLANAGYYRGPVDGLVGPGTQAAIAAYQRDNGLAVTGTINGALLQSLGNG